MKIEIPSSPALQPRFGAVPSERSASDAFLRTTIKSHLADQVPTALKLLKEGTSRGPDRMMKNATWANAVLSNFIAIS